MSPGPTLTLDPGQVAAYRDRGWVVLRGVFGADEVAAWAAECDRLQASGVMHPDNLRTHVVSSTKAPDRLDPVIDLSPVFRALASDPRVLAVASALLDDDAVLFKDKVILKPPGGRGYLTHQDYAYWSWTPAPAEALMSVVVAIDAATRENGGVELYPGCHHRLLAEPGQPGDVDPSSLGVEAEMAATRPGDVLAFHSLTPHGSGVNRSTASRRQVFLSYSAAAYGDLRELYYAHLHRKLLEALDPAERARAFFR